MHLFLAHLHTLSKPLNNKSVALSTEVDILDIIGSSLEMAGGIVTLGNEDIIVLAALQRLVKWDWWTLICTLVLHNTIVGGVPHTMNFSSILPRRSKPGASSRWWFALVSAIVETMAM